MGQFFKLTHYPGLGAGEEELVRKAAGNIDASYESFRDFPSSAQIRIAQIQHHD